MSIQQAEIKIIGVSPLLMNNPLTADRFNKYSKAMAPINAKKSKRTDDDDKKLRDIEMRSKICDIEMRSKIYWSDDLKIYVPTTWVSESIAFNVFRIVKTSMADVRGSVFTTEEKAKLQYSNMEKVLKPEDIVKNWNFRHVMTLKQGQVRVVKAVPIFHSWSFSTEIEFDDKILDPGSLKRIIEYGAKYGGFGDFRPTFGRAKAEVSLG